MRNLFKEKYSYYTYNICKSKKKYIIFNAYTDSEVNELIRKYCFKTLGFRLTSWCVTSMRA